MHKNHIALVVAATLTFASFTDSARAQAGEGGWTGGAGLGFTSSADSLSLGFELAHYVSSNVQIVPRLSVGLDDDFTYFFIMADGRYVFDVRSTPELKPYVGFGVGIAIADVDRRDSDAAFAFEFPIGLDYWISNDFSLGSQIEFIVPVKLYDDNFIFQWLVIAGRVVF